MVYKASLYKVDGTREDLTLPSENRLKFLQNIVEGLIEIINIGGNDFVVNEEGLIHDLPINPWSSILTYQTIWENHPFRGNIIVVHGELP